MGWSHIGGPAEDVYDAPLDEDAVLYKTEPNTGHVSILTPHGWRIIGSPGSMFAVNRQALWGLTPNRDAIFARQAPPDPYGQQGWRRVGGPADSIIAGASNIALLTAQGSGDLHMYADGSPSWPRIGGPGYMFAVSSLISHLTYPPYIYGVTPNQMDIWRCTVDEPVERLIGRPWERITLDNQLGRVDGSGRVLSRIHSIIAGVTELYADVEVRVGALTTAGDIYQSGNIYRYGGTPGSWTQIGSRHSQLAIHQPVWGSDQIDVLYSFNPNDTKLRRYTGTGTNWQIIDWPDAFSTHQGIRWIFSGFDRILVTLSDGDLWQYSHI